MSKVGGSNGRTTRNNDTRKMGDELEVGRPLSHTIKILDESKQNTSQTVRLNVKQVLSYAAKAQKAFKVLHKTKRLTKDGLVNATRSVNVQLSRELSSQRNGPVEATADLSGLIFTPNKGSKIDLSYINLDGANLANANMQTGVLLHKAVLTNANMSNTDLRGQDLRMTEFIGSDPNSGPNLTGAKLDETNLERVDLSAVIMEGASLRAATLVKTKMIGTNARNTILIAADLTGADLTDADLTGADLTGATLTDTIFRNADLRGAILKGVSFAGLDLRGANLSGQDLRGKDLRGTNLAGANLEGVNLEGAILTFADLKGAKLNESTILNGAILIGTNMSNIIVDGKPGIPKIPGDAITLHEELNDAAQTGLFPNGKSIPPQQHRRYSDYSIALQTPPSAITPPPPSPAPRQATPSRSLVPPQERTSAVQDDEKQAPAKPVNGAHPENGAHPAKPENGAHVAAVVARRGSASPRRPLPPIEHYANKRLEQLGSLLRVPDGDHRSTAPDILDRTSHLPGKAEALRRASIAKLTGKTNDGNGKDGGGTGRS